MGGPTAKAGEGQDQQGAGHAIPKQQLLRKVRETVFLQGGEQVHHEDGLVRVDDEASCGKAASRNIISPPLCYASPDPPQQTNLSPKTLATVEQNNPLSETQHHCSDIWRVLIQMLWACNPAWS